MTQTLKYHHLYTDDAGESHFRELEFDFRSLPEIENRDSITVSVLKNVTGAMMYRIKPGVVENWHTAPRKQFNFVVQGHADITASDGQVLRLSPGMVLLIDDTTGKGHITSCVGEQDHIALMIPVG